MNSAEQIVTHDSLRIVSVPFENKMSTFFIPHHRRTMAVHHRANGYVAVCIEPDGGCATMLFFEKWSDHHHAAMQARLLAGHDIPTG